MEALGVLCSNSNFAISCLKDWSKFGKTNFLQQSKENLETCISNLADLFIRLIVGDGKVEILPKMLSELTKAFPGQEFGSKLADVLWLIDSSVTDISDNQAKERFLRIVSHCKSVLDVSLLMERLSDETLEQIALINSQKNFQVRYVRVKTRLFFKQQKFNLLREESEGYAKLIVELSQPIGSMEQCMTQIQSLIGFFDLDPNRVLDIILDVFEVRSDLSDLFIELINLYHTDKVDLTDILGHKFHFYQGRDFSTPKSLHQIAALLITKKMVDVDVLLAHLQPSDDVIHSGRNRSIQEAQAYKPPKQMFPNAAPSAITDSLDNMPVGIVNNNFASNAGGGGLLGEPVRSLLGTAGQSDNDWNERGANSRPDQTNQNQDTWSPAQRDEFEVKDRLLSDGENGEFQHPNNQKLDLCASLVASGDWKSAQLILDRFPGHWIGSHPALNRAICDLLHFLIDPLYMSACSLPSCLMKSRRKPKTPELFTTEGKTRVQLELLPAMDYPSFGRYILPITGYLGPFISSDIVLIVKLCRICAPYLAMLASRKASPDSVYQAIFNMLDEVILPSLSMVPSNCCLSEDIWRLLRHIPYDHRFRLYGQWKHLSWQEEPALLRKRSIILSQTKAIMKRLSKENVKQHGRHLGKLSHSNPGVLFDYVLQSIQMFTNLIGPVVDSLKYVSSLGYDVLNFSLIEALASDRSKLDELQRNQSLQALANFTGLLCKKYQFDLAGIMQYVLNQLKSGRTDDLYILREIIHQMSGVDTSEEMTDEQLEAVSGGELLLQEGGYYAQIRNARKSAARLKEALIEHKLIMPMLFLMAQQRDTIVHIRDPDRHVKLAGRIYDQCQGTLVQFITFLSLYMTREEMQAQCLPLGQMMGEYCVPADTAFCLFRSIFSQRVARLSEKAAEAGNDLSSASFSNADFVAACRQVIAEVATCVIPLYPPRIWDELGATIFSAFWCLESGDLIVPDAAYQRQLLHLRSQLSPIENNTDWTLAKKKRETDRCQALIDRLSKEHAARQAHVNRVRAWLLSERETWFETTAVTKRDTITQFLQYCIYPRVCFTASDAIYAAQFIHALHQLKAARFASLICLDRIFNDVTLPISMCTEDEAHRYGRFLCAVLELTMRWHSSEEIFNQECWQFPGFVTIFRKGDYSNTKPDQLQYENYRHIAHKWHYRITKATVACLESGNYSQIRNALIVLTRILPHYPKMTQFGNAVERRVYKLGEEEKDRRPDLKALAFSYAGLMRPRKASWVCEEDFHRVERKAVRPQTTMTTATHEISRNSPSTPAGDTSSKVNIPTTETAVAKQAAAGSQLIASNSVLYHRSSKTSASNATSAQKRGNPLSCDEQNVGPERGTVAGEEIRDIKYRRTVVPETSIKVVTTDDPKEGRRLVRKRSALTAAATDHEQTSSGANSAGGGNCASGALGTLMGRSNTTSTNSPAAVVTITPISAASTPVQQSLRVSSAQNERAEVEAIQSHNEDLLSESVPKKARKGLSRTSTPSEKSDGEKRHRRSANSAHHHHRSRRSPEGGSLSPTTSTHSSASQTVSMSRHARK